MADARRALDPTKPVKDNRSVKKVIGATRVAPKKQEMRDDKRPHCKKRPDRASGRGGGKPFVPWC